MKTSSLLQRRNGIYAAIIAVLVIAGFFVVRGMFSPQEKSISLYNYLVGHSLDALSLQVDMQSIYDKDSSDLLGTLQWVEDDGKEVSLPLEVTTRGNNRLGLCIFPPLKLKAMPNEALATGKTSMKLVSHCVEGAGEPLLLREYLAYQLYASLTEASFRTHLIRITYTDSRGNYEPVENWAFLIEPTKDLKARLDAEKMDKEAELHAISAADYNRFAVFQFMIGNTDWNLEKQHNVKMLFAGPDDLPVPVPYDFDRSGLVNAPYAIPHSMLPINTVQDRFFQWRGKDRSQLKPVLDEFRACKERLIGVCQQFEMLSEKDREDVVQYLEEFFLKMDILLSEERSMAHKDPLKVEEIS